MCIEIVVHGTIELSFAVATLIGDALKEGIGVSTFETHVGEVDEDDESALLAKVATANVTNSALSHACHAVLVGFRAALKCISFQLLQLFVANQLINILATRAHEGATILRKPEMSMLIAHKASLNTTAVV